MVNHVRLDNIIHKSLRIDLSYQANVEANINNTAIFREEFRSAQIAYPIFFKKKSMNAQFYSVAMLGIEENENLFIESGKWQAPYIPLSIERQPFVIGFQHANEDGVPTKQAVIYIDMDSSRINTESGAAIFLEHGGHTTYLERVRTILNKILAGDEDNKRFIDTLIAYDLLESVTLKITLDSGRQLTVADLYTINEERLRTLESDSLIRLHKMGFLQDLYMVIASQKNITNLIKIKNSREKTLELYDSHAKSN